MIALLIVAHGNLGESLIQCAVHVLGRQPSLLESLDLSACPDPVEMLARARAQLERMDQGDGVLILTDIYGATPCNTVCKVLLPGRVEAISGVNLPMLLKALTYREAGLAELMDKTIAGGKAGIFQVPSEPGHA
jgi:PTS system ascorbate-specific IIA component